MQSRVVCSGCRNLLMYPSGATNVCCALCNAVTIVPSPASNVAHVNCGNCHTMLMYPYGAPSVKCAVCQYITSVNVGNIMVPIPVHRPDGLPSSTSLPSSSTALPNSHGETVVVENPMSLDKTGKLVSNVVVGVTTEKK